MYTELGLFIGGKWANGAGRKAEPVVNPANEKTLAELPHASKADLDEALAAAKKVSRSGARPIAGRAAA
jgi:succinate-semialdehyde dehydrogenase/glutarate-semialdehyde dehydrogenase